MKKRSVLRFVLLLSVVMTIFVSCSSDDNKTGVNSVSDTVKDGTWRIGYFLDSGTDKTQDYSGYNFTFSDNGDNTVLTATKENTSVTGIWSVARSASDADLYSTIFNIGFASPESFVHLSREWKVIENTGTSLKLKDDSNGDMDIKYLYFEKN